MHHIYQTEGFVLRTLPAAEESKSIRLMTRDLGLVRARAQGVRRNASKLRFALQEFSYCKISLVRGKEVWRIVNAVPLENAYFALRGQPDALAAVARILSLLGRLVSGEEEHAELFDIVRSSVESFANETFEAQEILLAESITVLRILAALGYASIDEKVKHIIATQNSGSAALILDRTLLTEAAPLSKVMIAAINASLQESQL